MLLGALVENGYPKRLLAEVSLFFVRTGIVSSTKRTNLFQSDAHLVLYCFPWLHSNKQRTYVEVEYLNEYLTLRTTYRIQQRRIEWSHTEKTLLLNLHKSKKESRNYCDAVSQWMNLLEFVKILFLKVMQKCKPICASRTLRCCFERFELVRTTAKALWHEDVALDEWSVT